ncbi:MAG: PPC domain-containing protein [Chloroflexi bacterium]|uniref:PPC domain-containing protein n=1 Tax=Candidatus Flexifilum breve TaxID=3140694 RepID=UPI003136D2C4|nr:PPC domain-containing protein [Chloroflexota bacterium]
MQPDRHPHFSTFAAVLLLTVLLLGPAPNAQAQIGGAIGYGSSVLGNITAAEQSTTYSFSGSVSDFVDVTIHNWTGTFDPLLELVAPNGQALATSSAYPFSDDPLAAQITMFLPQSGIYSLHISGAQGTTGEFILRLQGRTAATMTPLVYGQPVAVSVPINPTPQSYTFTAQTCPTVLTIANLSAGEPFTFPFHIRVRDEIGTEIAQFDGGDALEDRLKVAANSGRFEVIVTSADPLVTGTVQLLVTCEDQAPGCLAALSGSGYVSRPCPPCLQIGACADFALTFTLTEHTAAFSWPPLADADWYIFSIVDAFGDLLPDSALLLEGTTNHAYTFAPADVARGPFTAYVSAGAEGGGSDPLCLAAVVVSFGDHPTAECTGMVVGVDPVPGARVAVAHWEAVTGAAAYLIHVYASADDGGLIGIRVLTAPGDTTSYHLADVFPAEYDHYQIEVAAYAEATGGGAFGDMPQGYLCAGTADLTFTPLGPVEWGPAT